MRRVLPEPGDVDLVDAYAPGSPAHDGRLFVRVNMISSLDGAISVDGRSGPLGGLPDQRVFGVLRSWADVIVVGAGTMRAERYGPVRMDDAVQRMRTDRGQQSVPSIAVVSRAARFDYTTPFFTDATVPPIVITTRAGADAVDGEANGLASAIGVGDDAVDLAAAFAALRERGLRNALVEGGPTLNNDLGIARLLDELCLTLSPRIVAGDGPRILAGPAIVPPLSPHLVHMLEDDGFVFLRLALRPE